MASSEVERDGEKQESRPPVDGIEDERLLVADGVPDQPDDEPDEGHSASLCAPLAEPAAVLVVVEDDDVLATLEDDVEVASIDGFLRPPAVDDAPLFADQFDRQAIDETRRPIGFWLDEGGAWLVQSSRGTNSARASGIRDHGATSTTLATAPPPVLAFT